MKPKLIVAALALMYFLLNQVMFTVDVREQVIVTQFKRVVGEPIAEPGLHFKIPFLQQVNRFSKQVLEWDGKPVRSATKDKNYIIVDNFARWRIKDPLLFMQKLTDERTAQSRLDSIIGSETRNAVARHNLIEVVRSDKARKIPESSAVQGRANALPSIDDGRLVLEELILKAAAPNTVSLGIELLDVRFKRVNSDEGVVNKIYGRMTSERLQIAERFRSEGAGEAAKIKGNQEKELNLVQSTAYKKVQEIEGAADAKATEIYAKAYNGTAGARELFEFTKSLDTLKRTITPDTTLLMTTEGDMLKFLKRSEPGNNGNGLAPGVPGLPGFQNMPSLLDLPK
jgi:modulator of FtsH protease HflC